MSDNAIQYLERGQINDDRWDQCIDMAPNGLIYAYSYYLDHLAKHWDALVLGDYEAVMPLTWNRKLGIYYCYQPPFTASLGVFGNTITAAMVEQFFRAIPSRFRLIEIDLNQGNTLQPAPGFSIVRNNYVLDLHTSYDALYAGYKENIRRNIKRSYQLNNRYEKDLPVDEVIRLSKWQLQQVSKLTETDHSNFRKLYHYLHQKGQAITYGVYTPANELIASCVYFFSHKRAYYILVGNHPNGRTAGASHFLIDRFIHDHAGEDLLLDFEGSDISNLAYFYSSFGARVEIYPGLRINNLPGWVKVLKNMK